MFAKVSQLAEQVAINASRRQFLGRFGGTALTAAAVVGGFLAFPGGAAAGRRKCSTDADCPTGQRCSGDGRCFDPPKVCDASSNSACAGKFEGEACGGGTGGGGGICYGAPSCECGNPKPGKGPGKEP